MKLLFTAYLVLFSTFTVFSQCDDYRETIDKSFVSIQDANSDISKSKSIIGNISKANSFDASIKLVVESKKYVDDVMTYMSDVEAYAMYIEALSEECGCKDYIEPASEIQIAAEKANEEVSQLFKSLDLASKSKDASEFSKYYDDIVKYIKISDASINAMFTRSKSLIDLCK